MQEIASEHCPRMLTLRWTRGKAIEISFFLRRYGFRNRDHLPKLDLALSLLVLESLNNRITGALAARSWVVRSDFVTLRALLHDVGKIRTRIRFSVRTSLRPLTCGRAFPTSSRLSSTGGVNCESPHKGCSGQHGPGPDAQVAGG